MRLVDQLLGEAEDSRIPWKPENTVNAIIGGVLSTDHQTTVDNLRAALSKVPPPLLRQVYTHMFKDDPEAPFDKTRYRFSK